jgi:hypothetical protein
MNTKQKAPCGRGPSEKKVDGVCSSAPSVGEATDKKKDSPVGARPSTPGAGYYFIQVPVYLYDAVIEGRIPANGIVLYMTIVKRYALMDRIFPSYATLGRESGMGESTARRLMGQLRDVGAITWGHRKDEQGQSTNEYAIAPWKPFLFDRAVPERNGSAEGVDTQSAEGLTDVPGQGVALKNEQGVALTNERRVEDFSPITETELGNTPPPPTLEVADAPVSGSAVEGAVSENLYSQAAAELCEQISWSPRSKNKQQLEDKLHILVPDPDQLPEIVDRAYSWPQPDRKSVSLLLSRVLKIKKDIDNGVTPMLRGATRAEVPDHGHEVVEADLRFGW